MLRLATLFVGCLFIAPTFVHASALYINPSKGTYGLGDTFVAEIRLNIDDECINTAHVVVVYPKESLTAVDFGRGSSILSLWVEEPTIDRSAGTVSFSGGIPGGYCGRIQGDPSVSNILGKIVFTVTNADAKEVPVRFSSASVLYANDGLGTQVRPILNDSTFVLVSHRVLPDNPWVTEVKADLIAPDPFVIHVESNRDGLVGRHYGIFSTVDKQSGLDHYEIFDRGTWNKVTSPHELRSEMLRGGIQVRAVDKAGNMRLGDFVESSSTPLRTAEGGILLLTVSLVLILFVAARIYMKRLHPDVPVGPAA